MTIINKIYIFKFTFTSIKLFCCYYDAKTGSVPLTDHSLGQHKLSSLKLKTHIGLPFLSETTHQRISISLASTKSLVNYREAFLHDPFSFFVAQSIKRKRKNRRGVPLTLPDWRRIVGHYLSPLNRRFSCRAAPKYHKRTFRHYCSWDNRLIFLGKWRNALPFNTYCFERQDSVLQVDQCTHHVAEENNRMSNTVLPLIGIPV